MPWYSPPSLQYIARFSSNPPKGNPYFSPPALQYVARFSNNPPTVQTALDVVDAWHVLGPRFTRDEWEKRFARPGRTWKVWVNRLWRSGVPYRIENDPYTRHSVMTLDRSALAQAEEVLKQRAGIPKIATRTRANPGGAMYGYHNPTEWHPGGSHRYRGRLYRGSGRYHHHGRRPSRWHAGGGVRYGSSWHPGGGHYEANPGCYVEDDGLHCWSGNPRYGFAEPRPNPTWHPGGGMFIGKRYRPGSGRFHHHRRPRHEFDYGGGRWYDGKWYPGGGHYESNPEPVHDVLCQCGWGRLGVRESAIPAQCPVCLEALRVPHDRSAGYWEGVEDEQEDWDDSSWGAAGYGYNPRYRIARHVEEDQCPTCGYPMYVGDEGFLDPETEQLYCCRRCAMQGRKRVRRNACYGIHWHQDRPFLPVSGLYEAAHGRPAPIRSALGYLDNPDYYGVRAQRRHYGPFHSRFSAREFADVFEGKEFDLYDPRLAATGARRNDPGKYFTESRVIEGEHGPRLVERPWSTGTLPRTLEESKQHKSRMKGILKHYAKREFGVGLKDRTAEAMLGKSRAELEEAGKPKLAAIKARADQVFYAQTRGFGLMPGTEVPASQLPEPSKKKRKKSKKKSRAKKKRKKRKAANPKVRCNAKKKSGARCNGRRLPGKKVCVFHSSKSATKKKTRSRRKKRA